MIMRSGIVLVLSVAAIASGCGIVFAQDAIGDAGVAPGTTSASPFHIFDRFGDWVRLNVLTRNPIRREEVRATIVEERLAELKAITDSAASSAVTERAEALYRANIETMERRLTELDERGQNVGALVDRFNTLSLRHQETLGRVLEKAPEEAREAIKKSIDVSEQGLAQATKVVASQLEKGNLTEEKAREIVERTANEFEKKIEAATRDVSARKAGTGTVSDDEKIFLDSRIRNLENFLADLESHEELQKVRRDVRVDVSNAAQKALDARSATGIRDSAAEDTLRAIQNAEFDPHSRAKRMIAAADELIAQLERKIKEAEADGKEIPEKVRVLLRTAADHLAKAEAAFEAGDFGEAFGQANSAVQNAKNALSYFDNLLRVSADSTTGENRICAQVATPARSASGECKVFPNACIPDGWKRDPACIAARDVPKPAQDISSQPAPKPIGEAPVIPRTWEIKITDEGFFPKELAIKAGDSVVWTNGGSRPHRPASAMHPTHDVYPEKGGCIASAFDACRGLETGETFEFVFNHAGVWRYHDHMNAGLGGAIVVTARE